MTRARCVVLFVGLWVGWCGFIALVGAEKLHKQQRGDEDAQAWIDLNATPALLWAGFVLPLALGSWALGSAHALASEGSGLRDWMGRVLHSRALLRSVAASDEKAVERLLRAGADPNYVCSSYDRATPTTPLLEAVGRGEAGIAQLLLRFGADPNLQPHDGWRGDHPLRLALVRGDRDITRDLVRAGGRWLPRFTNQRPPFSLNSPPGTDEVAAGDMPLLRNLFTATAFQVALLEEHTDGSGTLRYRRVEGADLHTHLCEGSVPGNARVVEVQPVF
jgi:ankyrin repeat protein